MGKDGLPTKLIGVGMVSNGFTIADPKDTGVLDVVGFDAAALQLMADFIRAGFCREATEDSGKQWVLSQLSWVEVKYETILSDG